MSERDGVGQVVLSGSPAGEGGFDRDNGHLLPRGAVSIISDLTLLPLWTGELDTANLIAVSGLWKCGALHMTVLDHGVVFFLQWVQLSGSKVWHILERCGLGVALVLRGLACHIDRSWRGRLFYGLACRYGLECRVAGSHRGLACHTGLACQYRCVRGWLRGAPWRR